MASSREPFPTQGLNQCLLHFLHCRQILYCWATGKAQVSSHRIGILRYRTIGRNQIILKKYVGFFFFFAFVFVIVLVQIDPSSSRSINNVLFIKFSKYQPSPPHFTVILLIWKCSCLIHELFSRLFRSQENRPWNRPTWNRFPLIPSYLGWW